MADSTQGKSVGHPESVVVAVPWWFRIAVWGLTAVWFFWPFRGFGSSSGPLGLLIHVAFSLIGLGCFLAMFSRFKADETGLLIRNMVVQRRLKWAEVDAIRADRRPRRMEDPYWSIQVQRKKGRSVSIMAAYYRKDAEIEEMANRLQAWLYWSRTQSSH
jgi:hypothetical protein